MVVVNEQTLYSILSILFVIFGSNDRLSKSHMDRDFRESNRWSSQVIAMTSGSILFMIVIMLVVLSMGGYFISQYIFLFCVLVLPILIFAMLAVPISISIEAGKIKLRRVIGSLTIPIEDICSVRALDKEVIKFSSRMIGSAGTFGYLGKFQNNELGEFVMYITEKRNLVKIRTNKKTYVFNCRDVDRFIDIYESAKERH